MTPLMWAHIVDRAKVEFALAMEKTLVDELDSMASHVTRNAKAQIELFAACLRQVGFQELTEAEDWSRRP